MSSTDKGCPHILLILMVPLSVFTTDMYLSSFNDISEYFKASPFQLQMSLSIYFIGMAVFTLLSAFFIQKFGSKKILLTGLMSHLLGSLTILIAPNIFTFILARFLQSFGGSCTSVITRSMAAKNPSTLTFMFASMSFSLILAPILGGHLQSCFGWQANFVFMALITVFYLISTCFLPTSTPISSTQINQTSIFYEIRLLFTNQRYTSHTLFVVLSWGGFLSFVSGSPFFLLNYFKLSPETFSWVYGFVMTGFILGNLVCRKIKSALPTGIQWNLIASTLLLLFFYFPLLPLFIGACFLYFFGIGLILPEAQIKASASTQKSHYAFSLMYFLMMLFGALCGLLINKYSYILGINALVMGVIGLSQVALFLYFKSQSSLLKGLE